jgi:signal transduction histidine kinase/ligand-binding sensor domain-containing protein/CheY-like chemotaxis protein
MKRRFRTVEIVILLFMTMSAHHTRSSVDIRFDKIETSFQINTFIQDRDGFVWLGATNGLYKYDGYTFKRYTATSDSLVGNYISTLYEDSKGLIWIASSSGVNAYDKATDTFATYTHDPENPNSISSNNISESKRQAIAEDADGMIWFGTENGLNRFDKATQTFTRYQVQFVDNDIWSLLVDREGFLWVGTANGLHKFDPRQEIVLETYQVNPNDPDGLHAHRLTAITQNGEGILWIGSRDDGLLAKKQHTFTYYPHNPANKNSLSDNTITAIMEDKNGRLWIITRAGGFNLFDKKKEIFTRYRYDPAHPDPEGISNNYLVGIYPDDLGVIWIAAFGGTVYRVDPGSRKFQQYTHHSNNINSLSKGNYIAQVIEDREGLIWIAVGEGGLNRYDRKTRKFTHYYHDQANPDSLPESYAQSVFEDHKGNLWMASLTKLYMIDKNTGRAIRTYTVKNAPGSPISDKHHPSIIWWGSWGGGLLKFNTTSGEITPFLRDPDRPNETVSSNMIPYIYQDDTGMIWLCTRGGGLNKFDPQTEHVIEKYVHDQADPTTILSNAVFHIYQDSAARYWVSTDKGFHQFFPETGKFQRFSQSLGNFPLTSTSQIIEDNQGYLWIAGHHEGKLIRFDPDSNQSKLYTTDDGILPGLGRTFCPIQTRDGELWFYGRDGLNSFYPDQITDNEYQPPVFLTSLTQGGEVIEVGKALERVASIQLDWRNNYFEFEVAALNHRHPEHNQYRYILEGVDTQWFEAGTNRRGRYSALPDGSHTLKVMGSNNDGVWSDKMAELKVTVTPPWWRTWWFKILSVLLILGIATSVYYWRINALKFRSHQLEIQVSERTKELQAEKNRAIILQKEAETANQAKSIFLANMSHELRSPLNAILGFAQIITRSQKLDKENQENIGIINRSGEHLLSLINQVLDLSKIEAGRTTLNENHFDFYRLLDDLEDMFHLKADDKHLQLLFERAPSVSQYIYTDELKLRQVLINLLNNALKFTIDGGITVRIHSKTIETELKQQRAVIEFAVEDTGPGIAPDELDDLFTAFIQTATGKQAQEGTGLGLPISRKFVQLMGGDMVVNSEVGRGTRFQFQIQCQLSEASQIKLSAHEKRIIALVPNQPRYRILIVDDKWTNRQLLIKLLNPLGFELKEAENGQQAIDIWDEWQPHLIWMDMRMPVMDGYTATQQIKAHIKGQATAIVALTASVLEEERAVVIDAGCDDFLRKPFKENDIFDMMHKHIGVEYIYDDPIQTSATETDTDELTPDNLATLPAELLARFEQATDLDDPEQIESIINEIRLHHQNLANRLMELAELFYYDSILNLIRQAQGLQS